jgi:hypothetical protein
MELLLGSGLAAGHTGRTQTQELLCTGRDVGVGSSKLAIYALVWLFHLTLLPQSAKSVTHKTACLPKLLSFFK